MFDLDSLERMGEVHGLHGGMRSVCVVVITGMPCGSGK